jgi:hypothetical protein
VPTLLDLSAAAIRNALDSVLSAHEFAAPAPSPVASLVRRSASWVWGVLSHVMDWLLARLSVTSPTWQVVGRVALLAAAAVGVWLLVRLTRLLLSSRSRRERSSRSDGGVQGRPLAAADWESKAREASLRRRWREASVALYHAVVLRLAAEGHVRFSKSKTPGEYRREIAAHADLAGPVATFLGAFERVAFARAQAEERDYARLRELAEPVGARG